MAGTIDTGDSGVYTKDIGNYDLLAQPRGSAGSWVENIDLTIEGYIWYLEDFPTEKPTPTLTSEPTETPSPNPTETSSPSPIPHGNITINNNSSWTVNIYISGSLEGTITTGNNNVYTKYIGNYDLLAQPQGTVGYWEENIELTIIGYTWNLEINTESYPENSRIWNFENNYEDHLGIDDWDVKHEIACSAKYYKLGKFGYHSLSALNKRQGWLEKENCWIIGNSISYGAWINIAMFDYNDVFLHVRHTDDITKKRDNIFVFIYNNNTYFSIRKGDVYSYENFEITLNDNNWHYLSISYDSRNNILYGTIDNNIITINNPPGTWGTGSGSFFIFSTNWADINNVYYIDEAIVCADTFIDPQVFVDHYNHNVPWGAEYTQ